MLRERVRRLWYSILRFREPYKSLWALDYHLQMQPKNQPGRVKLFGWDIEYVDAGSLASMIKVNVLGQYNDFHSENLSPRILDCGSNIGISILRFKQLYPLARITAFEPDPLICQILRRNLDRNGASDVEVVEAAVWVCDDTLQFRAFHKDDSQSGHLQVAFDQNSAELAATYSVKATALSNYLTSSVDLLKLDIEGAEFEVLESISDKLNSIQQIMLEIHHQVDRTDLLVAALDKLHRAGFRVAINSIYGILASSQLYIRSSAALFDQPFLVWAWRD